MGMLSLLCCALSWLRYASACDPTSQTTSVLSVSCVVFVFLIGCCVSLGGMFVVAVAFPVFCWSF